MQTMTLDGAKRRTAAFVRVLCAVILVLTVFCAFDVFNAQSITTFSLNENAQGVFDNEYGSSRLYVNTQSGERSFAPESEYVKIGGVPIGIAVRTDGLIVLGENPVKTEDGDAYPSRNSGIEKGDIITAVNGVKVNSIYQLMKIAESRNVNEMNLTVMRGGKTFDVKVTPAVELGTEQKKLGLRLKEDVGGVGTLTFVTQDNRFAALGHYIFDAESGLGDELNQGNIYRTSVDDVIRGEKGKAGGLIANVNRLSSPIGQVNANTNIGLYGEYTKDYGGQLYRIAQYGEAKPGKAQVLTTIDGSQPKFYDIDIVKVVSQSAPAEKGMVIAVKDAELLDRTGGIVQGMSGSPIVQNGAIIGAVTHVFVQDPTRGYAVHSRFMLDNARNTQPQKQIAAGYINQPLAA